MDKSSVNKACNYFAIYKDSEDIYTLQFIICECKMAECEEIELKKMKEIL